MSIYEYRPLMIYCIFLAVILGGVAGSFLNCAAWRIVKGESFVRGRSHCTFCHHPLGITELIPVVSYVIQGGKCRWCGKKISVRYPLTELIFMAVSVLCLLRFDLTAVCLRNYLFLCCLFLLTLTDLQDMLIPDGCLIAALVIWAVFLPFTFNGWKDVLLHILAGFVYGGALLLISLLLDRILGEDSMGGGDIKLFAVTGIYLGFIGTLFAVVLSCVAGLLFRALPIHKEGGRAFPFGPAIAFSTAVILLYGEPLIRWYGSLL